MAEINPLPVPVDQVQDDPAKPWKAYAALAPAAILAVLQALLENGGEGMPDWLWVLISGLIAGVAVYTVRNPKQVAPPRHKRNEAGLTNTATVVVIGVTVVLLILLFLAFRR